MAISEAKSSNLTKIADEFKAYMNNSHGSVLDNPLRSTVYSVAAKIFCYFIAPYFYTLSIVVFTLSLWVIDAQIVQNPKDFGSNLLDSIKDNYKTALDTIKDKWKNSGSKK
jgi:hypothetical protein